MVLDRPGARSLMGEWSLHEFEPGRGEREGAHRVGYEGPSMVGRVPGNVQDDLVRGGRLPDPYVGENARGFDWVPRREWWYRHRFSLGAQEHHRYHLLFQGVDYRASLWVNGFSHGTHVGMFSPWLVEVTAAVEGENTIAVRLDPPPEKRRHALKCQMSYRWDFAPRLVTVGLWDEVWLVESGPVLIRDLAARWEPREKVLRAQVELDAAVDWRGRLRAVLTDAGGVARESAVDLDIPMGRHQAVVDIPVEEPRRWNPWELGEPHLYYLQVQVPGSDAAGTRVGLVETAREANPSAWRGWDPWVFRFNGERLFLRGANWVPADSLFGRLRRPDYERLLGRAREANMNVLRVWGGGLREKREFYDLCDEMGILVWQDLPFACKTYPRSESYLRLAEQEVGGIARVLRNHPSLFLWCGGNEYSHWRNRGLFERIEGACRGADPLRFYHPSSPRRGDFHNWTVWHLFAPVESYRRDMGAMASEFGLQACPRPETLQRMGLGWPPDKGLWRFHKISWPKMKRYIRPLRPVVPVDSLAGFAGAAQRAQAVALKTAIEHYRSRKYACGGCLLWMFNEPWPCISWSIVEHDGTPKMAWEEVRRSYQPILPILIFPLRPNPPGVVARLKVINDLRRPLGRLNVEVEVEGTPLKHHLMCDVGPDSVADLGDVKFVWDTRGPRPPRIHLRIMQAGRLLSENRYILDYGDRVSWFPTRGALGVFQRIFE
ncbi:MAG: hypothetical protein HY558_03600 [Euryarchaeota archaeon]|nr:hypothetical protein [Euryarchaeota archaeon]